MTREEWIKSAKTRIENHQEVIEGYKNASSCDSYWWIIKHEAEIAASAIKFLEAGIELMEYDYPQIEKDG